MTDTLKALAQDRDSKAQRAIELHNQWKVACKEAEDARDKFNEVSRQRREGEPQGLISNLPATKPSGQPSVNPTATAAEIDLCQPCEHYKKRISREKNEITKDEMRAVLGRKRLEQLELSLHECQQGKSTIPLQEELRPHDIEAFWIEKLLAKYRDNYGYAGNSSAELCGSKLDRLSLCRIAADLVDLIANELMENLKVIEVMKNRDGMLTTPGNIKDSLWYLICKQRGIDLSTKSVKERPAVIREALNQWPMDDSFQESNRIIRHWAALTHTQRSAGGKATHPIVTKATKEEIRAEYKRNPGKSAQDFCDRLTNEGWVLPDKRTVERYTKDLRQKK